MRILAGTVLALLCALPAQSQTVDDSSGSDSRLRRLAEAFTNDEAPIRPLVGVVVPGSSVAGGLHLEDRSLFNTSLGAAVEGSISLRNYRHVMMRAGYIASHHRLPEVSPADSSITSAMRSGKHEIGAALYAEYRFRRLPRLNFFGIDDAAVNRTDFGVRLTTLDIVGQWAPGRAVGVSARVGVLTTSTFAGTDDRRLDTESVFGEVLDAASVAHGRYVTSAVGVMIDRTDDAGRGWMAHTTSTRFTSARATAASFTRTVAEARFAEPLWHERHVAASRVLVSFDTAGAGRQLPYYLQQTLGGSSTLRGLRSYRLRGSRLLSINLESRWRIGAVEVVPFVDVGRAWRVSVPTGLPAWVATPGLSVRVRVDDRVVGRAALASGPDGLRFVYAFDAPF